jgi:hypothetical protein
MNLKILYFVLLAIGLMSQPVFATLIAYEGFDYDQADGVLSGRNGGTGWDTAWTNNTGVNQNIFLTNDNTSIPTPPNPYSPTGDRISKPGVANTSFATTSRNFNGVINTANDTGLNMGINGTLYLSYAWIKNENGGNAGDNIEIGLHDAAFGTRYVRAGSTSGSATAADAHFLVGGTSAAVAAGDIYDTIAFGTIYYTVIKVTANATGDDMVQVSNFTLSNPVPLSEPITWQKTTILPAADTVNLNRFSFIIGMNARVQFDEIRVGTTWGDVAGIPEPNSVALLLLSAVAGFCARTLR